MKLIHTSDIHLDACFAGAGMPPGFGAKRRHQLRETFAAVLRHAWTCGAEAVLIAGDLYEQDRVSRDTLAFLRDQFERLAPLPILIAPGNRDPYTDDSPWFTEEWPANVHIFNQPEWGAWECPGAPLTVHGFAFTGADMAGDVFARLRVPRDGRIHVALAHGAERSCMGPDDKPRAPFDLSSVAQPGLHYLALGHIHRMIAVRQDQGFQAWYPGPPEGLDFDESGQMHLLEVEIIAPESSTPATVLVAPRPSSKLVYATAEIDCSVLPDADAAAAAILEQLGQPETAVVGRAVLTGMAPPELRESLPGMAQSLEGRFEAIRIDDHTRPDDDFEAMGREDTALGEFVRSLTGERGAAVDPARRAVLERAREAGVAAFLGRELPVRGMEAPLP
jgi:hypothetical protein